MSSRGAPRSACTSGSASRPRAFTGSTSSCAARHPPASVEDGFVAKPAGGIERERLDPRRVRLPTQWTELDEAQIDLVVPRTVAHAEQRLEQGCERFDRGS